LGGCPDLWGEAGVGQIASAFDAWDACGLDLLDHFGHDRDDGENRVGKCEDSDLTHGLSPQTSGSGGSQCKHPKGAGLMRL
jgi:hypothetical protein